jgi:hypothetical protein
MMGRPGPPMYRPPGSDGYMYRPPPGEMMYHPMMGQMYMHPGDPQMGMPPPHGGPAEEGSRDEVPEKK